MLSIRSSHDSISKLFLLNPSSFFLNLLHCSTTSPSTDLQRHFMVDYLINSLGFTEQEAISAASKVRHLKSTKNSQSVIDFLKNYNLSETNIKSLVLSQPNILLCKVDKTLEPKLKVLSEIGISGPDLLSVVKNDPNFLGRGLHTRIIPAITYLRKILGSNEKIAKVMKHSDWHRKSFRMNVILLEKHGVCSKDIERVIVRNPRLITESPVKLKEKLVKVEREFGIKSDSKMFSYGLSAFGSLNSLTLRKKFELFKRFGWGDLDISNIAKTQPICFTHSEERLSVVLGFFMKDLGCTSSWLANRGSLLMYSLEKRVKPRYQVYKVLKEKGVIDREFYPMLSLSDVDFLKRVVYRHKEDMPKHLYESFTEKFD